MLEQRVLLVELGLTQDADRLKTETILISGMTENSTEVTVDGLTNSSIVEARTLKNVDPVAYSKFNTRSTDIP